MDRVRPMIFTARVLVRRLLGSRPHRVATRRRRKDRRDRPTEARDRERNSILLGMRPAHIHFQVSGRQDKIVTQMYFEADPYNKTDPFLNSAGEAGRQDLLVRRLLEPPLDLEPASKMVIFDIVLYKG